MKHLILIRKYHSYGSNRFIDQSDSYIIGSLYGYSTDIRTISYVCDTLESECKGLPALSYKGTIDYSIKFRCNLPLLYTDFLCRYGIRIHAGNTVKDTEGCILVGENKQKGKVLNSRKCLEKLLSFLEGDDFILTIIDSKNIKL